MPVGVITGFLGSGKTTLRDVAAKRQRDAIPPCAEIASPALYVSGDVRFS